MQLGTAVCLTGTGPEKIQRIPDPEMLKISSWMLQPGEAEIVAGRIVAELGTHQ